MKKIALISAMLVAASLLFFSCSNKEYPELSFSKETLETICKEKGKNYKEMKSFTIPVGYTKIEKNVFSDCASLKKVKIPKSVKIIDDGAFENCSKLKKVLIDLDINGKPFPKLGNNVFQGLPNKFKICIRCDLKKYKGSYGGVSFEDKNVKDLAKMYWSDYADHIKWWVSPLTVFTFIGNTVMLFA